MGAWWIAPAVEPPAFLALALPSNLIVVQDYSLSCCGLAIAQACHTILVASPLAAHVAASTVLALALAHPFGVAAYGAVGLAGAWRDW